MAAEIHRDNIPTTTLKTGGDSPPRVACLSYTVNEDDSAILSRWKEVAPQYHITKLETNLKAVHCGSAG